MPHGLRPQPTERRASNPGTNSLIFKSLKVRRLVDVEGRSVVYAVYSQRLDKTEDANNSRFKSNLCAVPFDVLESPQKAP